MNSFDVIEMLTNPDYKQKTKDYLHVIKGSVNIIDMIDHLPHYVQIIECMKALVTADKSLAMKSRLVNELTSDGRNLTDKQLLGMLQYVDKLMITKFLETCPDVETNQTVDSFDAYFDNVKTNRFDLTTLEGVSGFKSFMEIDFLSYLKKTYPNNPLVKHLRNIISEGKSCISTDIDLLNPDVSTVSKLAYDDILRGMAQFESEPYNSNYTITDMLQLYNLIVNSNQYGGERLTTAFKACSNSNNVLEKFKKFESESDYDFTSIFDFNTVDYQINSAPVVSSSAVRFHSEPYIKVKDPIWNYIIMRYNHRINAYSEYSMLPSLEDPNASMEQKNKRRINFIENCPFEMPEQNKVKTTSRIIAFEGELSEEIQTQIKDTLKNMYISGKLFIVKDC